MQHNLKKTLTEKITSLVFMLLGSALAAYALEVFLIPNKIIDGGVVGVSILLSHYLGASLQYPLIILLNIPFILVAYKSIGKGLVMQMVVALAAFAMIGHFIEQSDYPFLQPYRADLLELVVIGGMFLGLGVGLIIRTGGCLDGTEIMGILFNKKYGFSVGTVVLIVNVIIFLAAGFVYKDWHAPIQSLITFLVVVKIMDMVITGIDETKSVMIFTNNPEEVSNALMYQLGLGLTHLKATGGFTKEDKLVLYLIAERLQLAEIKSLVHSIDATAFVAISNLHELATTHQMNKVTIKGKKIKL
jgi:uncharacterized membrane-anchored protein YitT (DUF2179 family)